MAYGLVQSAPDDCTVEVLERDDTTEWRGVRRSMMPVSEEECETVLGMAREG